MLESLFRYVNKIAVVMGTNPDQLLNNGLLRNATVYSIITRKQKAATNIPWLLYEVTSQKAYSRALQLKSQLSQGIEGRPRLNIPVTAFFSKSEIKEVENHKVYQILEQPNPTQSWADLTESLVGYLSALGNAYEYGIGPQNGMNRGQFHELWSLPSQLVSMTPDKDNPMLVSDYMVRFMYEKGIPSSQVAHYKYWNPQFGSDSTQLYGLSPLQASRYTVQQSNDNIDSMLSQLQNIGAMGIIAAKGMTNDEPTFTREQAEGLQAEYREKFAGTGKRGKVMFSPGAIEWHQLGLSPVDLAIIESMNLTDRQICNAFLFPSLLIGDSTQKTFANYKEAKKALYTDCVIPDLVKIKERRNSWFLRPFGQADGKKYVFDLDYTAVPELQEDVKDMIDAYSKAYWITNDEKRALMKYSETGLAENQAFYVPSSFVDVSQTDQQVEDSIKQLLKHGIEDYN